MERGILAVAVSCAPEHWFFIGGLAEKGDRGLNGAMAVADNQPEKTA